MKIIRKLETAVKDIAIIGGSIISSFIIPIVITISAVAIVAIVVKWSLNRCFEKQQRDEKAC